MAYVDLDDFGDYELKDELQSRGYIVLDDCDNQEYPSEVLELANKIRTQYHIKTVEIPKEIAKLLEIITGKLTP